MKKIENLTGTLRSDQFKESIVYTEIVSLNKKINEIIDYLNQPLNVIVKSAYMQGYCDGRQNPLIDEPQARLKPEHCINLLKSGASPKLIGFINRNFNNPDSLFEVNDEN